VNANVSFRSGVLSGRLVVASCVLFTLVLPVGASAGRAGSVVVRGRIVAADTRLPIDRATVKMAGFGRAKTKANGHYRIRAPAPPDESVRVTIRAPGHVIRHTTVAVPTQGLAVKASWDLLPKRSDAFDRAFFDVMTRSVGVIRWEKPPVIRIIRNRLECRGGLVVSTTGECPEWFGSTVPMTSITLGWLRGAAAAMSALVAQAGQTATVEEVDLSPGQVFDLSDLHLDNVFTLGEVRGAGRANSAQFPVLAVGQVITSRVRLYAHTVAVASDRAYYGWIAHDLGFYGSPGVGDCDRIQGRGLTSFFCDRSLRAPTAFDLAMGRALYSRPIGSVAPDRDPVE